LKQEVEK